MSFRTLLSGGSSVLAAQRGCFVRPHQQQGTELGHDALGSDTGPTWFHEAGLLRGAGRVEAKAKSSHTHSRHTTDHGCYLLYHLSLCSACGHLLFLLGDGLWDGVFKAIFCSSNIDRFFSTPSLCSSASQPRVGPGKSPIPDF